MMDPSNDSPADGLKAVLQNGVHEEPTDGFANVVDCNVTEITETVAPNENLQNVIQLDNTLTKNSSKGEIIKGTNKEEEVKITDQVVPSKATKGTAKSKNPKPASPKGVSLGDKSKNRKDEEAPSDVPLPSDPNGTLALNSRTGQPIKSRSYNDRKVQLSKQSGKSDAAPSGAPMEKRKPIPLKKEPLDEVQAEQSSLNTTAEDDKPQRVGTLPNYGFSFKCDERAERRKEFYSKLEEKIHAKEVEKNNLQARTKETQEAEIKMLRKTLAFKATPMPSFYQEPLPKAELKKIPTTRAKSPKLGRRKSSTNAESEGNNSSTGRQGRLSLDEKMSESIPTKGVSPVHQKKPQRRSLPSRLPMDRTSSSNSMNAAASSKAMKDEKTSLSSVTSKDANSDATGEEKTEMVSANEENSLSSVTNEALPVMTEQTVVPLDESSEMVPDMNGDILVEKQPQDPLVQEPIAAEH